MTMFRRRTDVQLLDSKLVVSPAGDVEESLSGLYAAVTDKIREVDEWYLADKRAKRSASRVLRAIAIALASAGGLWPLLIAALDSGPSLSWGYVLLALAASCMGFDRFFGLSSGWMRDIAARNSIAELNTDLMFGWASECFSPTDSATDSIPARLQLLQSTAQRLQTVVSSETATWTSEFANQLVGLEQSIEASRGQRQ